MFFLYVTKHLSIYIILLLSGFTAVIKPLIKLFNNQTGNFNDIKGYLCEELLVGLFLITEFRFFILRTTKREQFFSSFTGFHCLLI